MQSVWVAPFSFVLRHFRWVIADFFHSGNNLFFIGNGNNIHRPKVNFDRNVLLSVLALYAVEYLNLLNERIYKRWGELLNIGTFTDILKKRFQIDCILLRCLDFGFCFRYEFRELLLFCFVLITEDFESLFGNRTASKLLKGSRDQPVKFLDAFLRLFHPKLGIPQFLCNG